MSFSHKYLHRYRVIAVIIVLLLSVTVVLTAQDKRQQVIDYLEKARAEQDVPAISAAVAVNGRIVLAEGVGYADLENSVPATGKTVYRIASISKPVGAIGVMQLLEQGKVSLEDEIQVYVPSFPEKEQGNVTLWHLLTHTSGIRHYNPGEFGLMEHFETLDEAIEIFKDDPLKFDPGTQFSYTTYGFNLVQGVIEAASEMPIADYMRRYVWQPAGMNNTHFEFPNEIIKSRARGYQRDRNRMVMNAVYTDVSIKFIGGGMISTVEDLCRLFIALDRGALISNDTRMTMYDEHFQINERSWRALGWSVGVTQDGYRSISHSGGATGFRSMLYNFVDDGVIVAVITNNDWFGVGSVAMDIARMYLPDKN
ncbi:serine hydrolase domain-containing protein [candidate division KSB1 bacterium]